MIQRRRGQTGRLIGAVLALVLLAVAVPAQEADDGAVISGGGAPGGKPVATQGQPAIKVQADASGALIPEVQRPPVPVADEGEPEAVSGGGAPAAGSGGIKPGGGSSGALDYAGWERMAGRAETAIGLGTAADAELDLLRGQLVTWRETLLTAQSANSARIATLRQQIDALGPAPAEGVVEADEIAARRAALSDQLTRLQAPGIAADEAYTRADGMIREIDRLQRVRQTDALLKLWPNPLNPANWPAATGVMVKVAQSIWLETSGRWHDPAVRQRIADNLLLILPLLLFGVAVLARGWRWANSLVARLRGPVTARGRRIFAALASLVLIFLPVLATAAVVEALRLTGLFGPVGLGHANGFIVIVLVLFAAIWLGDRVFPKGDALGALLDLPEQRRAEGRLLTRGFGVLLAFAELRRITATQQQLSDAAWSVLNFPIILIGGILLIRFGMLMRQSAQTAAASDEGRHNFGQKLIGLLARVAMAFGAIGPAVAALGYISAGWALVFPTASTLGLAAILYLAQNLIADVYNLVLRRDGKEQDLAPVLIGFALAIVTLPVFALIWGARVADLTELWTRFQEGFQLGDSRISPTDFVFFAVIFFLGLSATRLLQGALKNTVLPRTHMDQGAQNAVVSGLGYVGILLAALLAINSTGIDLSGLAIVAGALSVGIGFGLQTVVSNFVSGIILLIERPVSEGDWIEVGGVQGIVQAISVRSTRIQTFDRSDVIVPNSDLISGRVTNWTRFSLTGRLVVPVNVPFTSDSRKVEAILREIAEAQPLALLHPPPTIALMGFGAEVMSFEIRVILRDVNFSVDVRSEINHQIVTRFAEEGIRFSNAHRDFLKKQVDDAAAVVEQDTDWALQQAAVTALLGETRNLAGGPTPPVAMPDASDEESLTG